MSAQTEAQLKNEFDRVDADASGAIDEDEFTALLSSLGVTLTPEDIQIAFLAIDVNGNRRIEFGEFKSWWAKR